MKVLAGYFTTESNANIPMKNDITDYIIAFGDECTRNMQIEEIFTEEGIEIIPSIYATAGASGVIRKETFDYIEASFLRAAKEHQDEIDGVYLHLHGASEVEEIGSGDHHILFELRKIVGPYVPIAVCCDPHGNLCKEYVEDTQIIRSYRQSPHTDSLDTMKKVAGMLCQLMKKRQDIHAIYRKLPLILGGEQSVSTDEPVKSINSYMDKLEEDSRILSASWHVGYIRHDCDVAGCGIVVVPATGADQKYAEEVADSLASYVWERRHDFHYTGLTLPPDKALQLALEFNDKPAFITDSGDNVTSGATGWNTYILHQVLALREQNKKILFSNICDPNTWKKLDAMDIGTKTHITLGVNKDEMSRSVELDVTIRSKGGLRGYLMHPHDTIYGFAVVISVEGFPIDIVVASSRQTMCEEHQFVNIGIDWNNYDIIVVKQGYIFPDLKEKGKLCIMSLTNGSTPQDTKLIPFRRIMRPMFPIDSI